MEHIDFPGVSLERIIILGSTGSIGRQALEVLEASEGEFLPVALSAHRNASLLLEQVERFSPEAVSLTEEKTADREAGTFREMGVRFYSGQEGLLEMISEVEADRVLNALVGTAGLLPTMRSLELGRDLALANKESLVAAGSLVMETARSESCMVIPVDSEHSAIFQCLRGEELAELRRIIITASGGPFRETPGVELAEVGVREALDHPTWKMGRKITIDSATLLNKGLEVIEAHHLFGVDYDHIEVIVHPQSIIHSLVEMEDGSLLAQLGWPDIRLALQDALTYPRRGPTPGRYTDLAEVGKLSFEPVNMENFPCLELAYRAGREGATYPAALIAADEEAVGAFLSERISFLDIERVIRGVLDHHQPGGVGHVSEIIEAEERARDDARRFISRLEKKN